MTIIMLKLLLLCLSSFLMTAVNTTNYSRPLVNCRGSDIDLLLVTYLLGNSTLQIQRLKNIVRHFLPEGTNETLRLRVRLLDVVNSTHSQHLIDFNDHNTTEDLTSALDNLIRTDSDKNISYHTRLKINAGEIFKRSSRIEATRLAIMLTQSYEQQTFEKSHGPFSFPRFEQTRYFPFYFYYIIDTAVSRQLNTLSDDNVLKVSGEDIVLFNETVCGQCKHGWIPLMKTGTRSPLSCFYIGNTSYKRSNRQASSDCKKMKADLVTLETKEELLFLEQQLSANNNLNLNASDVYYVYVGFTQNKDATVVNGLWDNGRPLTFKFPWEFIRGKTSCSTGYLKWKIERRLPLGFDSGNVIYTAEAPIVWTDETSNPPSVLICEYEVFRSLPSTTTISVHHPEDDSFLKVFCHPMFTLDIDNSLKSFLDFDTDEHLLSMTNYECHLNNSKYVNVFCKNQNACEIENKCKEYFARSIELDNLLQCPINKTFLQKHSEESQQGVHTDFREDYDDNDQETYADECLETMCSHITCLPSQWFTKSSPRSDLKKSPKAQTLPQNKCFENCIELLNYEIVFCDKTQQKITSCSDFEGGRKLAPRCVYLKSSAKKETGCPDLSHLNDCEKFKCSEGLYKCPFSYCIPLYMINNGVQDCPYGEDESITIQSKSLFQCFKRYTEPQNIFLLPVHVCDMKTHCPHGEDESDCQMTCATGFQCGWNYARPAIPTAMIHLQSFKEFNTITEILDVSGVDLSNVRSYSRGTLIRIREIYASHCNLVVLSNIFFDNDQAKNIEYIDFSHNNIIEFIDLKLFYDNEVLHILNLSHNKELNLIELDQTYLKTLDLSFTNITSFNFTMKALEHLNLSHTRVHVFYFPNNLKSMILVSLDVRSTDLNIDLMTADSLAKLQISSVFYCDYFKMCCPRISGSGIPFCVAPIGVTSSCEKLLDDPVKRTLLWVVAVVSVVGNLTVLLFRFVFESAVITKSYRLFVSNLGLSDLIMGIYLLIIAVIDLHYRDNYVMFESEWRHSTLCSVAGFLATWSSETSAMFVLLITIERYLAVRFPFGTYRIPRNLKYFLLTLSWTVGFVLSLLPLVYQDWGIYSSNGMCLGLPMSNHPEKGLRFSFGAFLVLPGVLFILIAIGQIAIFQNISGEKTNLVNIQSAAKRRREITVAKNLSLVVMSNFLCWFPLFVFGLMATNGHDLSHELYSWLVVFVLPLNSAINPVLYTLPIVYKRWEEFKNRHAVKDA